MKEHRRPKKFTRKQKIILSRQGYDPTEYLLVKEWDTGMLIIHKTSGETVEARFR